MRILRKLTVLLLLCGLVLAAVQLSSRHRQLQEKLVRLHVVANSDSEEDQQQKLAVRDAVTDYLRPVMDSFSGADQAKQWIQSHLPEIQETANRVLRELGSACRAVVGLTRERFDTRHYDTFSLPAGLYDSLKIEIGEGKGHNWWCVVFPSLCVPAAAEDFAAMAVDGGLSQPLAQTLTRPREVRFFLLDLWGSLENFFAGR